MIDLGACILHGKDCMTSVAIRTDGSFLVSACDHAAMYALAIEFHRMGKRNVVGRKKLRIAVTSRASIGQVSLGHP